MNLPELEKSASADVSAVKASEAKAVTWIKAHAGIVLGCLAFIAVCGIVAVLRHL
jgi:hypothetical protein